MSFCWHITITENAPAGAKTSFAVENSELVLGRYPGADVVIGWDKNISRFHTKLQTEGALVRVTDLNSTNGSFILQNRVWARVQSPVTVPQPATIKLGATVMQVSFTELKVEDIELSKSLLLSQTESVADKMLVESILVLDLCRSSTIANQKGDQLAFHLKKRLFQICDSVFEEHVPAYVKNTGDGLYATFQKTDPCVHAAIEIIKKLEARNRISKNAPIDVRIALHCGETFILDERTKDRHGNDLNIAFRMEGVTGDAFKGKLHHTLPESNRIVVSRQFINANSEYTQLFKLLGPAHLKGIQEPVELWVSEFSD